MIHVSLWYLLTSAGAIALSHSFFGEGRMDILWNDVTCQGDEKLLSECDHSDNTDVCFHVQDASVLCPSENCQQTKGKAQAMLEIGFLSLHLKVNGKNVAVEFVFLFF